MAMISISTSKNDQGRAASVFSKHLNELGYRHAYIGGFAWSLLGSTRPTEINVLIEVTDVDIPTLREKIAQLDSHFARAGIKFYFVKEPQPELQEDELVRVSRHNVMIETLQTGRIGLPTTAGPTYLVPHEETGESFAILHPSVLILTKLKRWAQNHDSTRPKTVLKNKSDQNDLDYIIYWLAENHLPIGFDDYQGKGKDELLGFVRTYRNKFAENQELMETLQSLVEPLDWDNL
ncbi:hypothetical protein BV25DRAFT_1991595 [Artomyces pyxidatus]|uniref:Uncharacterized protein n=1 Tax=Artomyces pyxidatus TaxID=48021 RepID=A0ACB8T2H7_9AGAM|nr:hypothetical protein BV25DRAFT_1991595 [Artomyces pyxidatus]